jgi:hypothetical protein
MTGNSFASLSRMASWRRLGRAADLDRREQLRLCEHDGAQLGQFEAGAEGAGPGRRQTERAHGRITRASRGSLLRQKMLQRLAVTPVPV